MRYLAALPLLVALALPRLDAREPAADPAPVLTVLFTAESHAALLPCDCPLEPLGGVARRAALIEQYRARGPVLLIDGGGWAAGGLYDELGNGDEERDLLRSELTLRAMQAMGYDAILSGRNDRAQITALREKRWPEFKEQAPALVGWPPERPARAHWTLMEKRGPFEQIHVLGLAGGAGEPAQSLLADAPTDGLRVLVCRQGEEASEAIAEAMPGRFHLIINAGRKSTDRIAWTVGGTTVANFDYQAQRLGVAEIFPAEPGGYRLRVRHRPIDARVPDHEPTAALLAPHLETLKRREKKMVTIEYWKMADCPYCAPIEPALEEIALALQGRVRIEPHFVVSMNDDGSLASLRGEDELREGRIQALVAKYFPEKIWDWLRWRRDAKNRQAPWQAGAQALGLLEARIAGALEEGEGDALLKADYALSLRRHVRGTPSLVIDNRVYDGEMNRAHVLQALCGMLAEPLPGICAKVPKCFHHAQCKRRGYVGRCLDGGKAEARCDFATQAVPVQAVVYLEPDSIYTNHEKILRVLLDFLPGLAWRIEAPDIDMLRKLGMDRLPAYVIDAAAKEEVDFAANLGAATIEANGALALKPDVVGAHRILKRPRMRGRADLFVARHSKAGQQAVDVALALQASGDDAPELRIHDALFWQTGEDGAKKLAARGGVAEVEDAAIAAAIRKLDPEKLPAYLLERGKIRASLFWDRAVVAAGLDVQAVRALAEGPAPEILKELEAQADLLAGLEAGGDVVLLGENCELIPVQSRAELRYYLQRIGARRTPVATNEK